MVNHACITGAGGGLGRAFAMAFAANGWAVSCADINLANAQETADLILQAGGEAHAVAMDVSRRESTDAAIAAAIAKFGALHTLINNAAIYATLERKPFFEITEAEWDLVMNVNLKGTWNVTASAQTHVVNGGHIINIASATVMSGSPLWAHYVASKGGVIALTRVLAKELGDRAITVNAIAPGFTLTQASLDLLDNAATYGVDRGAIKRPSQPEDIVGAALFLASDNASYITGQTIVVDGGKQFI